jgi:pimeloyl-ACP methyl ester carboxylesterase
MVHIERKTRKEHNLMADDKKLPLPGESREQIVKTAETLVGLVTDYTTEPRKRNKNQRQSYNDLTDTAKQFFETGADIFEKGAREREAQLRAARVEDASSGLAASLIGSLQQKAGELTGSDPAKDARKNFDKSAQQFGKAADDARKNLSKGTQKALKNAQKESDKWAKRAGKEAPKIAHNIGDFAGTTAENVGKAVKDAHLDKKLAVAGTAIGATLADFGHKAGDTVKDAHLDKKLANVGDVLGSTFQDLGGKVEHTVKDAKFDKKLANVGDTVGGAIEQVLKDTKLDKTLANVGDTLGSVLDDLGGKVEGAIKDAKLDKKLQGFGDTLYDAAKGTPVEKAVEALPFVEPKRGNPLKNILMWSGIAGGVVGGVALNNRRIFSNVPPLESKLPGSSHFFRTKQGAIFYKVAGEAKEDETPVVFVHGIGAGNHSYEWLPNFAEFAKNYKCYAFDLLGFGNSERRDMRYTAELYIKQLMDFMEGVLGGQPAYVVASSLSGAYAAQLAYRKPELIKKLVLMSPTGINPQGGREQVGFLPRVSYGALRAPVLDEAIYSNVAARSSIRSFMERQMFLDKNQVTDEMVNQFWTAAHQPGAKYAPPSFFTGLLDASLREFDKLKQPILIVGGKEAIITKPEEQEALKRKNPKVQLFILDRARMSVNWERADEFNRLALDFLGQAYDEATKAALEQETRKSPHAQQEAISEIPNFKPGEKPSAAEQVRRRASKPSGDDLEYAEAAPDNSTHFTHQAHPEQDDADTQGRASL